MGVLNSTWVAIKAGRCLLNVTYGIIKVDDTGPSLIHVKGGIPVTITVQLGAGGTGDGTGVRRALRTVTALDRPSSRITPTRVIHIGSVANYACYWPGSRGSK